MEEISEEEAKDLGVNEDYGEQGENDARKND